MALHKDPSRLSFVGTQAALKAGEILRHGFGSLLEIKNKPGQHNVVTQYDHAAEKAIIDIIQDAFPSHAILAEESGASDHLEAPVTWIIDPLDGTLNFAHNIPSFSVSIGAYSGTQMLCGIVYQPMTNEFFIAEHGMGAYLNGTRIHVTKTRKVENALLAAGLSWGDNRKKPEFINPYNRIFIKGAPIRDFGSAALHLAYMAAGRFDAFWAYSLSPWDIAAGVLLLTEAGGKFSRFSGEEHNILTEGNILATNSLLHHELLQDLSF